MFTKSHISSLIWISCCSVVLGHGIMESPPARNKFCGEITKPDQTNAGTAEYPVCATAFAINPVAAYNFMAVVTHTLGRASVTPLPAHVCGFDGETWKGAETPWDVPMEWPTTPMTAGMQTITWNITWGPHFDDTHEFRYWITKADFVFSPTKALAWDDFETEAFCILTYDDTQPLANPNVIPDKAKAKFATSCNVPVRNGHHVIYGEWGRTPPTLERFHGCIDASFSAASIKTGRIRPTLKITSKKTDMLGRKEKARTRINLPLGF